MTRGGGGVLFFAGGVLFLGQGLIFALPTLQTDTMADMLEIETKTHPNDDILMQLARPTPRAAPRAAYTLGLPQEYPPP